MKDLMGSVGRSGERRKLRLAAVAGLVALVMMFGRVESTTAQTPAPRSTAPAKPAAEKASWQIEWEKTLAAARKEGPLVVDLSGGSFGQYRPVIDYFAKKFEINVKIGRGDENRLLAERTGGRYEVDVGFYARSTSLERLIPGRVYDPIAPVFFLPEILDTSLWWDNRHVYADADTKKFNFAFADAAALTPIELHFRTDVFPEKEMAAIDSIFEFNNPRRFKGKIVSQHPDWGSYTAEVAHPDIGEKWLREFFSPELGVFFATEARPVVDGIGLGRFPLAIRIGGVARQVDTLISQGVPIKRWSDVLKGPTKERPMLRSTAASNHIGLINRAPHPNAAKLFINWWLSKEGQTVRHKLAASRTPPTYRLDVKEFSMVSPAEFITPGVKYIPPDDPMFNEADVEEQRKITQKIWAEVRKK
jgi:iron(III) transport system substrate-binding protein